MVSSVEPWRAGLYARVFDKLRLTGFRIEVKLFVRTQTTGDRKKTNVISNEARGEILYVRYVNRIKSFSTIQNDKQKINIIIILSIAKDLFFNRYIVE
jgi:hypothetical protein